MGLVSAGLGDYGGGGGGGSFSRTSTDPLYEPQIPNLVVSVGLGSPFSWNNSNVLSNLTPKGWRVTVPKTGTLHDLSWWVNTQSGNLAGLIYDTGDASAGNRTLLYSSGSVACGAAGWQTVDPAISVTAGQQLDFLIVADNVTAAFMRTPTVPLTQGYPANFAPAAGGASPKIGFSYPAIASLASASATVAEASVTLASGPPVIIARVA